MSKMEKIINELSAIAGNPKQAVTDYKVRTGKGAVGILPYYVPEELVYATGYLPVGIWGGQKKITKAPTYLPAFACSMMQSVMELEIEGAYDCLDAILMSVPCDTLKCLSQKWKGTSPVIVFTHPQNRKMEAANTFLVEEYKILKAKLEKILGVTITDKAIQAAIDTYNENKKTVREFSDLVGKYPQLINPVQRHAVMKARLFMDKAQHTALVKKLIAEMKAMPVQPWSGKKVILTGIMAEPAELLKIFNEFHIAVVADDLAQEGRQVRVDAPAGHDPLYRLAKVWQNLEGCSLATDTKKFRGTMLMNMVKKYQADAVIICMMKFCDPEEWDYPVYYRQFQEAGIKSLLLEIEQQAVTFEQAKTRVQSLIEML